MRCPMCWIAVLMFQFINSEEEKYKVVFLPQFQGHQGKVNKSRRKLSVCQHEDPLQDKKKLQTNNMKAQRDYEHGYQSALGHSPYDNALQRGQVSGEECPCVLRSPYLMPFKAVRRFCCRPESSAEAPQESYVAVKKKGAVTNSKTSKHTKDISCNRISIPKHTCSRRLMESCSTVLSKCTSSRLLSGRPCLVPRSECKLQMDK